MSNVRFQRVASPAADTGVLAREPEVGDKHRNKYNQTVNRTLGSEYYIEDVGSDEEFFELTFNQLEASEKTTFQTFFNIVKQGYSFTYTDASGTAHTDCFLDQTELSWVDRYDRHTVTIKLRRFV